MKRMDDVEVQRAAVANAAEAALDGDRDEYRQAIRSTPDQSNAGRAQTAREVSIESARQSAQK